MEQAKPLAWMADAHKNLVSKQSVDFLTNEQGVTWLCKKGLPGTLQLKPGQTVGRLFGPSGAVECSPSKGDDLVSKKHLMEELPFQSS